MRVGVSNDVQMQGHCWWVNEEVYSSAYKVRAVKLWLNCKGLRQCGINEWLHCNDGGWGRWKIKWKDREEATQGRFFAQIAFIHWSETERNLWTNQFFRDKRMIGCIKSLEKKTHSSGFQFKSGYMLHTFKFTLTNNIRTETLAPYRPYLASLWLTLINS